MFDFLIQYLSTVYGDSRLHAEIYQVFRWVRSMQTRMNLLRSEEDVLPDRAGAYWGADSAEDMERTRYAAAVRI